MPPKHTTELLICCFMKQKLRFFGLTSYNLHPLTYYLGNRYIIYHVYIKYPHSRHIYQVFMLTKIKLNPVLK